MRFRTALLSAGVVALAACSDQAPTAVQPAAPTLKASKAATPTGKYLIFGSGTTLPSDIAARVSAAGGTITRTFPEIGVAVAASGAADFASRASAIGGVESVVADQIIQFLDPNQRIEDLAAADLAPPAGEVASLADDEPFYFLQWAPAAVQAPEAWNAGFTGRGVRVAIIDGAVYDNHIDLRGGVDVAASRSFVPGTAFNEDVGTFWHGTHVAGIVGARDNGVGAIGIAPNSTLIGVKALHAGTGAFEWVTAAILYAATPLGEGGAGAHVINMSLGASINWKDKETKAEVRELKKSIDRATRYAWQQGVTVIASAGNGATNYDQAKELLKLPAENQHVISVAATGPIGWALGDRSFSRPSSYTDHGKSLVDLAAPGGDFALPGEDLCQVGPIVNLCWVFDMYLSTARGTTANGGYSWAAGTSMAAPVTSGIAALVIEAAGGSLQPAQVEARLKQGSVDLGKPGQDIWYGHGWVNAYQSVLR
jgi:subtilisin family serine protease